MNSPLRRVLSLAAIFVALAAIVQAHPGHDDGHELTWDFSHLAAHPLATFAWAATLALIALGGVAFTRRHAELRIQSLRGSQPTRGK